jgi:hypothetical protein
VIETAGAAFCPYHLPLAEVFGDERVRRGAVPKKRMVRIVERLEQPVITPIAIATPTGTIASANVPVLAESAESGEQSKAPLLEAASSAATPDWLTVECPKCGKRSRVAVPVHRG